MLFAIQNRHAFWVGMWGSLLCTVQTMYVVIHDLRMHRLSLCGFNRYFAIRDQENQNNVTEKEHNQKAM